MLSQLLLMATALAAGPAVMQQGQARRPLPARWVERPVQVPAGWVEAEVSAHVTPGHRVAIGTARIGVGRLELSGAAGWQWREDIDGPAAIRLRLSVLAVDDWPSSTSVAPELELALRGTALTASSGARLKTRSGPIGWELGARWHVEVGAAEGVVGGPGAGLRAGVQASVLVLGVLGDLDARVLGASNLDARIGGWIMVQPSRGLDLRVLGGGQRSWANSGAVGGRWIEVALAVRH